MKRICKDCKQTKDISEFKFSRVVKGKPYWAYLCKKCDYKNHRAYFKEYNANLRKTEDYKKYHIMHIKKSVMKFPEKQKARVAVKAAIKKGLLKQDPCIICGTYPVHAHHADYTKPLKVEWYCQEHHENIHHGGLI